MIDLFGTACALKDTECTVEEFMESTSLSRNMADKYMKGLGSRDPQFSTAWGIIRLGIKYNILRFDEMVTLDQIVRRLPGDLVPKKITKASVLSALTQLKTERNNAISEDSRGAEG